MLKTKCRKINVRRMTQHMHNATDRTVIIHYSKCSKLKFFKNQEMLRHVVDKTPNILEETV
jgi:hypothetical protein